MTPRLVTLLRLIWFESGAMLQRGEGDRLQLIALRIVLIQWIDIIEPD